MVEYKIGTRGGEAVILKDGHTMFIEDVVKDLQRKAFLEKQYEHTKASTRLIGKINNAAHRALHNPNSSKSAKTAVGSALSQPTKGRRK